MRKRVTLRPLTYTAVEMETEEGVAGGLRRERGDNRLIPMRYHVMIEIHSDVHL